MERLTLLLFLMAAAVQAAAEPVPLFLELGPRTSQNLPAHTEAAQTIRLNRSALHAPSIAIQLGDETFTAIRTSFDRSRSGQHIWSGYLRGHKADTVILTLRGSAWSGLIQQGTTVYRIGNGGARLFKVDIDSLPPDDVNPPLDGGGETSPSTPAATVVEGNIQQDLLVAYTQGACNYAGGCSALEADITTAVADLNNAYTVSGINITLNLAGMAFTDYSGTNASTALSELRMTSDGQMDELHPLRDQLGADVVALVYDGQGCGIGYLPASPSSAFSVTDVPCLVGNRTMAHEIGHNQGAHHDRATVGAGDSASYNYGYRRCNDSSVDSTASPWFRTVMSYSCNSSGRVGYFSNPNVNYLGVKTGVDPLIEPQGGAFNARTLNESATYVAGFRTAIPPVGPPTAPTSLTAQATDQTINLTWTDNADNEAAYDVQRSLDASTNWSTIASLPAETENYADSGLTPETTYRYRVAARNSNATAYSNEASATTGALPTTTVSVANRDLPDRGTLEGNYTATHSSADNATQSVTEVDAGGPRNRRKQSYTHGWSFDLPAGGAGGVIVQIAAAVTGSEGALFSYSIDAGVSWVPMFSVDSQTITLQSFNLPAGTSGSVQVRVIDATQQNGETRDSVLIDLISITSINDVGTVPAAPTSMTLGSGANETDVRVTWVDESNDEFGFEILRDSTEPDCTTGPVIGAVGPDTQIFDDTSATPGQTYHYKVRAYNAAGGNCSNGDSFEVPTPPPGNITASYRPYKVKGIQRVDITWTGASVGVDVYRDSSLTVSQAGTGGTVTDDQINRKGGGSYVYQICEQGGISNCTQPETVQF